VSPAPGATVKPSPPAAELLPCLSEAYPDVKAALDAERAAAAAAPVDPGICEVAEAEPALT
jgi:hypothetical protein